MRAAAQRREAALKDVRWRVTFKVYCRKHLHRWTGQCLGLCPAVALRLEGIKRLLKAT
jgi:hypothetical protein